MREKKEAEDKVKQQAIAYEEKLKDLKQSVEKSKIESERLHMETLLQERLNLIEAENQRKKREYEIREKSERMKKKKDKPFYHKNLIHKSEKLEITLPNLMIKINKMKIILSEFGRNFNLEVQLTKNMIEYFKDPKAPITILIRVDKYYKALG